MCGLEARVGSAPDLKYFDLIKHRSHIVGSEAKADLRIWTRTAPSQHVTLKLQKWKMEEK